MSSESILTTKKLFSYYKHLGEQTIDQIPEDKLFWQYNEESNSIAIIVKHLWGNMLSRWTDFLTSDGEKSWRERDAEFENDIKDKEELLQKWNEGWKVLFLALDEVTEKNMHQIVYIRNQGHTVQEAIQRQLAHYAYHVGQMVFVGKMILNAEWESLSIPRGQSATYNAKQFSSEKKTAHFTEEFLPDDESRSKEE